MKARFLLNPASNRGAAARHRGALEKLAAAMGSRLEVSTSTQHLIEVARRAVAEGVERLLVAGGDGTQHHVLQALAGSDCALGVIPLGSGNDLAGSLRLPWDREAAVVRALQGPVRSIDLGRAGERVFAIYTGAGFDSEVSRFAREVRWRLGPLIYPYSVLRTLASFTPLQIRIEHDLGIFEGRAMLLVAANCPRFGGGMRIAPDARLDDGLLDLVMVREVSKLELLRVFPKVYKGTHVAHPAVDIVRSRRAVLTLDRRLVMYGDGEPMMGVAAEPVEITVWPRALKVAG